MLDKRGLSLVLYMTTQAGHITLQRGAFKVNFTLKAIVTISTKLLREMDDTNDVARHKKKCQSQQFSTIKSYVT